LLLLTDGIADKQEEINLIQNERKKAREDLKQERTVSSAATAAPSTAAEGGEESPVKRRGGR
jgi:hypothetical protein